MVKVPKHVKDKLAEIRNQLKINQEIIERDHPEGPMVEGKRVKALPHTIEVLNGHINDRLNELDTLLDEEFAELKRTNKVFSAITLSMAALIILSYVIWIIALLGEGDYWQVIVQIALLAIVGTAVARWR